MMLSGEHEYALVTESETILFFFLKRKYLSVHSESDSENELMETAKSLSEMGIRSHIISVSFTIEAK